MDAAALSPALSPALTAALGCAGAAPVPATPLDQRLDTLEAFNSQVGSAINDVVSAVLELRATVEMHGAATAELESMKARLKDLEQQLSVERAGRDLAQVSRMHPKTRSVVFVGTTYFGDNVKYAWAAVQQRAAAMQLECWFLPYGSEQEQLVATLGGRCLPAGHANWTPEHIHAALSAAVLVTSDHFLNPNPFAAPLLAGARHVQLWHGVSIKEIGLRNLAPGRALGPHFAKVLATCGHYARFVGTAAHAEPEWRRWFAFERYAPIGYPRNDVLYREPGPIDLANVDHATHELARQTLARGKRVLLYAPTFRDGRPGWVLEAGLERLAQAAAQGGDLLVVNLHPVEQPQIAKLQPLLPGVAFVASRCDLYPLLAQCSALITDYSSLMFDYLHLDRPVLLFRPDHAAYTAKSRRLFDHKLSVLPGPLFEDAAALAKALRRADLAQTAAHAQARRTLLNEWFDHHDGKAGERLATLIEEELGRAGVGVGQPGTGTAQPGQLGTDPAPPGQHHGAQEAA